MNASATNHLAPCFGLKKSQPLCRALPQLLRALLSQADRQQRAILNSDDAEAVHQYRVAIRKARSLLRLFRSELGPIAALLARQLAAAQRSTNALREVDVLMQAWPGWSERLSAELQPGAEGVVVQLQDQRVAALHSVRRQLLTMAAPLAVLADSLDPLGKAERPLKKPVLRVMRRQKRRLRRALRRLTPDSPATDFHRARIAAKRMRYLLEFFAELKLVRQSRRRLERLKALQELLGQLQDAQSHARHLADLGDQSVWSGCQQAVLAAVQEQLCQDARQTRDRLLAQMESCPPWRGK